jgi:hypothetical protein
MLGPDDVPQIREALKEAPQLRKHLKAMFG